MPPASAVQVTVDVEPDTVTTATPAFVAVLAWQVAAEVMSQSEPSMTRYSVVSATLVMVTTISSNVCVSSTSVSAALALSYRTTLLPSSVKVGVVVSADSGGSSLTLVMVIV